MDQELQTFIDQRDIHQILMRFCRAIDRGDEELLRSCYHPYATYDYGDANGLATEFIKDSIESLAQFVTTQHSVSNYYFLNQTETTAKVETYCNAYHRISDPDGDRDMIVSGRYLDDFEKANGEWRIQHRTFVFDWNQTSPSIVPKDSDMFAGLSNGGERYPNDLSYWFYLGYAG